MSDIEQDRFGWLERRLQEALGETIRLTAALAAAEAELAALKKEDDYTRERLAAADRIAKDAWAHQADALRRLAAVEAERDLAIEQRDQSNDQLHQRLQDVYALRDRLADAPKEGE